MTPPETRPALLASPPGTLGGPIRPRVRWGAPAPLRGFGPLARVWYAYRATRLASRLQRVETELLQLTAQTARQNGEGRAPISREDLATYEGCCIQRALLRAQIDWCRTLA